LFRFQIDEAIDLRLWEERHAEQLLAVVDQNREYLRQWLRWVEATKTLEDVKAYIQRSLQYYATNNGFKAGIWYQGQLAGGVSFHHVDWDNRKLEIGYWLAPNFSGKGIMTKTCRALVDYAFTELKINRINIVAAIANTKSRAIPERLGFTQEGIERQGERLHGQYVDLAVYSILVEEWGK
jgi:ribosomal-protein-serine acetyltransferase